MSWTEQKIQMLKDMWGHGYSASEIAKHLGGLTRNAVIGKAHRLKLSSRPSPIKREDEGAAGLPGSVGNVMPVMKQTRKRVMLRPLPVVPTPSTVKSPASKESYRSSFDSAIKRTEGIAVTKAGDRHCRWPVGDPRSPDFRFCGCNAYEGMPYCIDHARVAYQSVGRKQRAAEGGESAPAPSSEFRLPGQSRF
jgi:GcrA cell cycle regulator